MNSINICSAICLDSLISEINNEVQSDVVDSVYTEKWSNGYGIKHIMILNTEAVRNVRKIAECISAWIIEKFEKRIMCEILKMKFCVLDIGEIFTIIKLAENRIGDSGRCAYRQIVSDELSDYILLNTTLDIDGFVRFRLKKYREKLEELIDTEINEYLLERECNAVIDLLQEYIQNRYSHIGLVHVTEGLDGKVTLLDFKHNNISILYENFLLYDSPGVDMTYEDKLLGILLVLNPKRIIWHEASAQTHINLTLTVEKIFGTRVSRCEGCNLCKKH